jgi:hypothetical protein
MTKFKGVKKYILSKHPILDRKDEYMFFGNHKVAMTSVNRHLLKNRTISIKSDRELYINKLKSYSLDDINRIFKFTIVRNPFARIVSAFFYLKQMEIISLNSTFNEFIRETNLLEFNPHFHTMYDRVVYDGELFVDFVAKLESIETDWKFIQKRLGIKKNLPHKNKSTHKDYRSYYNDESKNKIIKIYSKDLNFFGYKF